LKAWGNKMKRVRVGIVKLGHFRGELPEYQTEGASGFDVRAQLTDPILLKPMARILVPTGLVFEIPLGWEIQVRARSGWALKQGISVLNSPGTIDSDYRGELKIILANLGDEPVTIEDQERVAQLVLCPVHQAEFVVMDQLTPTARGDGGFGSTGRA
jgi:dUTP pyrophosphatase